MIVLDDWRQRQAAHHERVDSMLADQQARQRAGQPHPVEDFLFTYYVYRPKQLRRWHPGLGYAIPDSDAPHARWQQYHQDDDGMLLVDAAGMAQRRSALIDAIARLMRATLNRAPVYGCFGMHEWAMVYRLEPDQIRHSSWPLRMPADDIAEVVEERGLRCTHFDAYRFFTPAAVGRNALSLSRQNQHQHEQPGCLHAGMDLYKWAYKLAPATSSALIVEAFELARDIRYTDMQASPYDLRELGLPPIAVETAAGRAQYASLQRQYTERAHRLREQLLHVCDRLRQITNRRGSQPIYSSTSISAGPGVCSPA